MLTYEITKISLFYYTIIARKQPLSQKIGIVVSTSHHKCVILTTLTFSGAVIKYDCDNCVYSIWDPHRHKSVSES